MNITISFIQVFASQLARTPPKCLTMLFWEKQNSRHLFSSNNYRKQLMDQSSCSEPYWKAKEQQKIKKNNKPKVNKWKWCCGKTFQESTHLLLRIPSQYTNVLFFEIGMNQRIEWHLGAWDNSGLWPHSTTQSVPFCSSAAQLSWWTLGIEKGAHFGEINELHHEDLAVLVPPDLDALTHVALPNVFDFWILLHFDERLQVTAIVKLSCTARIWCPQSETEA